MLQFDWADHDDSNFDRRVARMRTRIAISEKEMKHIAQAFPYSTMPVVFVEQGMMPTSKGKKKKCIIFITVAGCSLLRPHSSGHGYKTSDFISPYSLVEIGYADAKRRNLVTKSGSLYFISDHADEVVAWMIAARAWLLQDLGETTAVQLTSFPSPLPTAPADSLGPKANLAQFRYLALCQLHDTAADAAIVNLLVNLSPRTLRLFLDDRIEPPYMIRCLALPLVHISKFTTLHFRNFCPNAACRLAHYLMKKSGSVRALVFEGYSHFVPAQLRLDKLPQPSAPVTVGLVRCPLTESLFEDFMLHLSKFTGKYQRLVFVGLALSVANSKSLLVSLKTAQCFDAIEVMQIDAIDSKGLSLDRVERVVRKVLKYCRFLVRFSLSDWSSPLRIQFQWFQRSNYLAELVLVGQDLTQLSPAAAIPPNVRVLDLTRCAFEPKSLAVLVGLVADVGHPMSLVLADIKMSDAAWRAFFEEAGGIPRAKCITELNWSGNPIETAHVKPFVELFLTPNPIRFLAVDRVFSTMQFQDLKNIINALPRDRVFGFSIGGASPLLLACIPDLLALMAEFPRLAVLHLNGQKIAESDIMSIIHFLKMHRSICEISIDDTRISDAASFLTLYRSLLEVQGRIVGRPFTDLAGHFANQGEHQDGEFLALANQLATTLPESTVYIRSGFFTLYHDWKPELYVEFQESYPDCSQSLEYSEDFGTTHVATNRLLSLCNLHPVTARIPELSQVQRLSLIDPHLPPRFSADEADDVGPDLPDGSIAAAGLSGGRSISAEARSFSNARLRRLSRAIGEGIKLRLITDTTKLNEDDDDASRGTEAVTWYKAIFEAVDTLRKHADKLSDFDVEGLIAPPVKRSFVPPTSTIGGAETVVIPPDKAAARRKVEIRVPKMQTIYIAAVVPPEVEIALNNEVVVIPERPAVAVVEETPETADDI
jgi:hypothetical protein